MSTGSESIQAAVSCTPGRTTGFSECLSRATPCAWLAGFRTSWASPWPHPGQGQDGPSSLGLIESTDGGQTWDSMSLSGQADFHALEMRHGQVYGYNSMTAQFMVSDNLRTWQTRTQLPMADFTVSPDDPNVVLATTESGLARSTDGGTTFALVERAPPLLLVSWSDDGSIVGLDPDGRLYASGDGGASWRQRGDVGAAPEALEAVSDTEIYAAAGGKVLASTNGGRTFEIRYGG
jgi:photosystem II stability/assembly factor-like uncharacterized protein